MLSVGQTFSYPLFSYLNLTTILEVVSGSSPILQTRKWRLWTAKWLYWDHKTNDSGILKLTFTKYLARLCSKYNACLSSFNLHSNLRKQAITIVIPILQIGKLSVGKIRWAAQGHTSRSGEAIFEPSINFKTQFSDFKSSIFSIVLQMYSQFMRAALKLITKQNLDGLEIKVLLKYKRKRRSEPLIILI